MAVARNRLRVAAGDTADALLEASVAGSFTRLGLAVRSRLLPEFTADDRPDFAGRVAIVTGATSGLGLATATELAGREGVVHFLARDEQRAARTQREITASTGNGSVSYGIADMSDLDSVRRFARRFGAEHDRLDVLIHNAGAMHDSYRVNADGVEVTFAGHVIAPFLLTSLLLPQLRSAAPARVITVSSGGMYTQSLAHSVAAAGPDGYRGATVYARAKRAQVALSAEWARRTAATEIAFHAMHPGWADTPGVAASLPTFHRLLRPALRSPQQGADTAIWLATADPGRLGSGRFWHDRRSRRTSLCGSRANKDDSAARELWDSLATLAAAPAGDG